ncbi:MAG TPA: chloride channel protein [Gemmatimonadales bacterium]|nr:chloride channel protein [Gemmatimonadales bacterium]
MRRTTRGVRHVTYGAVRPARGAWDDFVDWFNALELSENAILLGFAVLIGIASALGVVAFYKLIDFAYIAFFRWPGTFLPKLGFLAYRPVVTGAGLVVAWLIMRQFGQGNDGLNVPDVQVSVVRRGGVIPSRPALARTAASAVTIGAGGAAGSEGPVAVLGAAIGSLLGRLFRFASSRVTVLVAAGAAGGISAAFNAPLAGAFFALEEILGTLSVSAFPTVVVSSVVAAVVSRAAFGNHPAFGIPMEYGYRLTWEVAAFYPLLGVIAGLVSVAFVRIFFAAEEHRARLKLPPALVAALGGVLVGGLVFASRGFLVGTGHVAFPLVVFGRLEWYTLAALALGEILATSITLNSGGSGGLFTPSLYVGAATGGAVGVALQRLFPSLALHPEAYALVGMGALIAGATDAPITGILLVFEMTNDYAIIPPLMLAAVISYVIARWLEPDSLYSGWLRRRGEDIEHGTSRDVLAGLRVGDAYERRPDVIPASELVSAALRHLGRADQETFPVIDADGLLIGVLTLSELGQIARDRKPDDARLTAGDVADDCETVAPADTLLEAIHRMGTRGSAALPVVDPVTGRLLGLLSRSHVLGLYERAALGAPEGIGAELAAPPSGQ